MEKHVLHMVATAHLDPVWLWDWEEGMNEGVITCKTILDILDQYPKVKFTRGEAAVYKYIEENDPVTFERIKKAVKSGQWEIVGGNIVQSDTNMPLTTTFMKQFVLGKTKQVTLDAWKIAKICL